VETPRESNLRNKSLQKKNTFRERELGRKKKGQLVGLKNAKKRGQNFRGEKEQVGRFIGPRGRNRPTDLKETLAENSKSSAGVDAPAHHLWGERGGGNTGSLPGGGGHGTPVTNPTKENKRKKGGPQPQKRRKKETAGRFKEPYGLQEENIRSKKDQSLGTKHISGKNGNDNGKPFGKPTKSPATTPG